MSNSLQREHKNGWSAVSNHTTSYADKDIPLYVVYDKKGNQVTGEYYLDEDNLKSLGFTPRTNTNE